MYFYFKILCDYKEDDDAAKIKLLEDEIQDKVVIYNEVIDTMRAMLNLFKLKKYNKMKKHRKKGSSPTKNHLEGDESIREVDEISPLMK